MDDWQIYEGKHEAIIDDEAFNKVQSIAKTRYTPRIK